MLGRSRVQGIAQVLCLRVVKSVVDAQSVWSVDHFLSHLHSRLVVLPVCVHCLSIHIAPLLCAPRFVSFSPCLFFFSRVFFLGSCAVLLQYNLPLASSFLVLLADQLEVIPADGNCIFKKTSNTTMIRSQSYYSLSSSFDRSRL